MQLAGDEGEEIARLGMGIVPDSLVHGAVFARLDFITVGKQHRVGFLGGAYSDSINRQHVRAIQKIGDTSKALRLTLGAQRVSGRIQATEFGIGCWVDNGLDDQGEAFRHLVQRQRCFISVPLLWPKWLAIEVK